MKMSYRLWQFWRNLTAKPLSAEALREITAVLTPTELALYQQYSSADQQHSYAVFCALKRAGHIQANLLAAALLHDVGKVRYPLSVWERSLVVGAMAILMPRRVKSWEQKEAVGWQRPFVIKAQHPQWGAQLAEQAGSHPLTIALIRRHQDKMGEIITEEDRLLQHLQWADDQN
jgi:predicted HD phosphohydrolase